MPKTAYEAKRFGRETMAVIDTAERIVATYQQQGFSLTLASSTTSLLPMHSFRILDAHTLASATSSVTPGAPVSVDGNAALQVVMTDKGEPGPSDTIAITVWNKSGGLWFASKWDSTKTVEQILDGGNLVVR